MQSDTAFHRESDHDDPGYGHCTRRANQNWGECKAVIDRIDTKITELQATRQDVSETMACQQGHCPSVPPRPLRHPTAQRH